MDEDAAPDRRFGLGTLLAVAYGIPLSARVLPSGLVEDDLYAALFHLAGREDHLELPLLGTVARAEVFRQHSWLTALKPPEWLDRKRGYVWEFAWLDVQEQRHGATHPLVPMPQGWRGAVKVWGMHVHGHDSSGQHIEMSFDEIPVWYQQHLLNLGYDATL